MSVDIENVWVGAGPLSQCSCYDVALSLFHRKQIQPYFWELHGAYNFTSDSQKLIFTEQCLVSKRTQKFVHFFITIIFIISRTEC